ncbi:MAG: S8 family serine peptidase [Tabrizicola sp.]|nr:S8 family serine peptidase [Tabrizicola sp.]
MSSATRRFAKARSARPALAAAALLMLGGCGGGGEGGGDSAFTIAGAAGGSGAFGSFLMETLTQDWRDAAASFRTGSARFRFQDGTIRIGNANVFANPLHSSRVDYAHALGLSGAGAKIAIVDGGYLTSHEALSGAVLSVTGAPPASGTGARHGTMVASIAAGESAQMVGVAPGAELILGYYGLAGQFAPLTAAADDARVNGAVAQNNSWGFADANRRAILATQDNYDAMFGTPGGSAWMTALERYALGFGAWEGGVVVFAVDNTENGAAGLMDGLPHLRPDLEKAWIAVGNAVPIFNDSGITGLARLESSACHESAAWCLLADGYWTAAGSESGTTYTSGVGSSFAAPQVSGALALLAEAFPDLTPHQLRARLLATADNRFPEFALGTGIGVIDLLEGPEVFERSYNRTFGHGFLDIRAALMPIGPVALVMGDGTSIKVDDFGFATGGAMGDAVAQSLEGLDLAATDAFGGGFGIAAKSFARAAAPEPLARAVAARAFATDYAAARTGPVDPLARIFEAHAGDSLTLAGPDGATRAAVLMGEESYGLAVTRRLTDGALALDLGIKLARDDGTLMGFSDQDGAGGAEMAALTLALSQDLGAGGFFALSGEIGLADLAAPAALSAISAARFDSLGLEIGARGVLTGGDRLALGLSMPVAITAGEAAMLAPVARADGGKELRSIGIDLAPEERQIDLSVSYMMPMGDAAEVMLELVHAENHGNRAGVSDSAAVIGMKWNF